MSYDKIIHSLNLAGRCSISKNIKNQVLHNGKYYPPELHQQAIRQLGLYQWLDIVNFTLKSDIRCFIIIYSSFLKDIFSTLEEINSISGRLISKIDLSLLLNVEILN